MNTVVSQPLIKEMKSRGRTIGFFVPIKIWETISGEIKEDLEASLSERYKQDIKEARKSKKTYSLKEVEDLLFGNK